MSHASNVFDRKYSLVATKIEYSRDWENGTGYFDPAVKLVRLSPGKVATSISPMPNSRRIVFVGTRHGTVVVFERFTPVNGISEGIIVHNSPRVVERLFGLDRILTEDGVYSLIGADGSANIGERLEDYIKNDI